MLTNLELAEKTIYALVAYRALRERMRDPSLPPRRILVPAPLVVRESTHRFKIEAG